MDFLLLVICSTWLIFLPGRIQADEIASIQAEDLPSADSRNLLTASYHWSELQGGLFEYARIQPNGDGITYFYDYYSDKASGEPTAVYNMAGSAYRYFFTESLYLKARIRAGHRTLTFSRRMGVEVLTNRRFSERFFVDGWSLEAALELGQEWRWDRLSFGISYYAKPTTLAWKMSRVRHRESLPVPESSTFYEDELKEPRALRIMELNFGIIL